MTHRYMTQYMLDAIKGWPSQHAVAFAAPLSADITDRVVSGTCLSLNSDGELILGCGNDAVMPMFAFPHPDDPDVSMDGGDPATDEEVSVPIGPSGKIVCLPAAGAFELWSTQYLASDEANFVPNAPIYSPKSGGNEGLLCVGTIGTNTIVGITSSGITRRHNRKGVAFWPWFGPPQL